MIFVEIAIATLIVFAFLQTINVVMPIILLCVYGVYGFLVFFRERRIQNEKDSEYTEYQKKLLSINKDEFKEPLEQDDPPEVKMSTEIKQERYLNNQ